MQIGEPGGFLDWLTEALDSVVRLGRGYQESHTGRGAEDLFESVLPVVDQLIEHKGVAFLTVGQGGVEFDLSYVSRPLDPEALSVSVRRLIADGTFAWALYQTGPIVAPSGRPREWLLLHVLATPAKVHGMFVAVLAQPTSFVPDVSQMLLSLVLASAASVLDCDPNLRPRERGAPPAPPAPPGSTDATRRSRSFELVKRGRVLLVGLDRADEQALAVKLRRLRCEVIVAHGAEGSLSPILANVDLTFVGAGGGNEGAGSLEKPRSSAAPSAPCVLVLDGSPASTWESLPTDVDGVLTRPVRLEALEAMLDRWIPVTGEDGTTISRVPVPVGAGSKEGR